MRNFDLLGIEPERLNGLILSHGHRDHYGGLAGFVAHYRDRMRDDLRLVAGGKEAFREKWVGSRDEEPASWGALDRAALEAAKVETVYCECAHGLDGPFTSGNIARQSFERVLPNTLVEPTPADHFTEAERRGRLVPDRHPDEHATCYVVRGRGLVVISSCSHCGLINAIRQAMAVSGVDKLHAVLGGFHLGVAPPDYVEHTIGELTKGPDTRCGDPDALHGPGLHRQNAHRNARAAGRLEYRKPLHLRCMNGAQYSSATRPRQMEMTDFPDDELHTKPVTFMGAPYSHDLSSAKAAVLWRAVRLRSSPLPHRIPTGPDGDTRAVEPGATL